MSDNIIEMRNVSVDIPMRGIGKKKKFRDQRIVRDDRGNLHLRVLDNINLEVKRGERIGIRGTNGAGKTTLLRAIAGLLPISSGDVVINGTLAPLIKRGAGTYPHLSGRQNASLHHALLAITNLSHDDYIADVEDFCELGDFFDMPVNVYSSGMKGRLQFAMVTAQPADVLIMDEWMGVADRRFQVKARDRLRQFVETNEALLFASHNRKMMEEYTDRFIRLEKGRIVEDTEE